MAASLFFSSPRQLMPAATLAVALVTGDARGQAVAPPPVPKPPPTFLHDKLGLPDNVSVRAVVRVRPEFLDGQFRPAPAPRGDRILSVFTSLYGEYRTGPFRVGGELFDGGVFFATPSSTIGTNEVNRAELGQAYLGADLHALAGLPGAITAGRFTMDVGSRRLVARNLFRNTINTFTGLRYDWAIAGTDTLRAFYTLPDYRLPDGREAIFDNRAQTDRASTNLQFFGGAYTKGGILGGSLQVQSYGLLEYDSFDLPTRNRRLFTSALRLARASVRGKFDHDLEAVYQTGQARLATDALDRTDRRVSAYFLHGEIGYTFDAPWRPRLAAAYDHASGIKAGSSTISRFDTLFGGRRWEYGPTSIYGAVQRSNLVSPGLRFDIFPSDRYDGFVYYRTLFLESATDAFGLTQIVDPTGRSGRFAGHQIDTNVRYWLVPRLVRIDSGLTYLVKGPFLRNAPNVQDKANTLYAYSAMILTF